MNLIKWYLWRRWLFKAWVSPTWKSKSANNLYKCNIAGCRDNPIIHRDMVNIISKVRSKNK